jgi:hypothetical protein
LILMPAGRCGLPTGKKSRCKGEVLENHYCWAFFKAGSQETQYPCGLQEDDPWEPAWMLV